VAHRRDFDRHLAFCFLVGADERESRIAAQHLAVTAIEHAAARTVHRFHLDLVESLQHGRSGLDELQRDPRLPWIRGHPIRR